jgi:hypothetical protein
VAFYDGKNLLAEFDQAPYTYTLSGLTKGEHVIKAVVTDDEGRTGSSSITINVLEPTGLYQLHKTFNSEGSVPNGWTTFDGNEKRVGYSTGYSSGPRVFHFTASVRDFEWGLYTRNVNGNPGEGYARFADPATSTTLTLYPGNYQLYHRVTNWNRESFAPVTIAIEKAGGQRVYAETFTPTCNIGNSASNEFSGSKTLNFTFDIIEKGRYVVTFYTEDSGWADLVVGLSAIRRLGEVVNIDRMPSQQQASRTYYYNMAGQRVQPDGHGPYIMQTVGADGKVNSRITIK